MVPCRVTADRPLPARWRVFLLAAAWGAAGVPAALAEDAPAGDVASAEEAPGFFDGFTVHGEVEAGGQVEGSTSDSSRFEEYRHVPQNAVLPGATLRLDNERFNYFADLYAEDITQEDQRYYLRFGRAGRYDIEIGWDQIPHRFSNAGRTIEAQRDSGDFRIPDAIQRALQADPSGLAGVLAAARSVGLRLREDTGLFRFRYTPTPEWEIHTRYAVERQRGRRPISTASSFAVGADVVELPEPIEYLTHSVDVGVSYGRRDWRLEVGYLGSLFENDIRRLVWDNPLRETNTVGGFSRGRLALPPDNQAHGLLARGALALPLRTRLSGEFSRSWLLQDDAFLPLTSNRALAGLPRLPGRSLGGRLDTTLVRLSLTARALAPVTVTARYRFYDLDNRSRGLFFRDYVQADTDQAGVARRNLPYAYTRQSAGAELRWRPWQKVATRLRYDWEQWRRDRREVTASNEHRLGPALDLTPWSWLLLRASYEHAIRSASSGYDARAPEASLPAGDPVANPRLTLLRKFDEAHRQRDAVDLLAQVSPRETLSLTGALAIGADDFDRSRFGLLDDDNASYSFDLAWNPTARLTLGASYTREEYRYRLASRYRPAALVGGRLQGVDDPANDWLGRGLDTIDTVGARLRAGLVPDRVDVDLSYDFSSAVGRLRGRAAPGGDPAGEAVDFPNVRNRLHQIAAGVSYRVRGGLWARIGYAYLNYAETDFAQDRVQPFMGGVDPGARESVFLGARVPDQEAHIGTFTFAYRF
jgi:MtrB/PioB family decaheme-associated outer membrane protein